MPKLKDIETDYEKIRDLVRCLNFEKKMALMKDIALESGYRKGFYEYTKGLAKKYRIPKMSEKELDDFLHAAN